MTAIVVGWSSKVKAIVVGWPSIIRAIVVDLPKKCYSGEGSSNLMNIGGEGVPQARGRRRRRRRSRTILFVFTIGLLTARPLDH